MLRIEEMPSYQESIKSRPDNGTCNLQYNCRQKKSYGLVWYLKHLLVRMSQSVRQQEMQIYFLVDSIMWIVQCTWQLQRSTKRNISNPHFMDCVYVAYTLINFAKNTRMLSSSKTSLMLGAFTSSSLNGLLRTRYFLISSIRKTNHGPSIWKLYNSMLKRAEITASCFTFSLS